MLRLYLVEDGAGSGLESLILTRLDWPLGGDPRHAAACPSGGEWANLRALILIDDEHGALLIDGEADHEPPAPREEQRRHLALYHPDGLQEPNG
jgi:hypothetical protein